MAQGESPAPFFDKGLRQASLFVCLPTPFDCLYLFTYRSRPVQTNKKIDDFFFAWGCRAGILLDFQTIIARGPENFTGESDKIDEDG